MHFKRGHFFLLVHHFQHILGHHLYTNIDGADPDIVTSTVSVVLMHLPVINPSMLYMLCLDVLSSSEDEVMHVSKCV